MAISLKDYNASRTGVSVGSGGISLKKLFPERAERLELDRKKAEQIAFDLEMDDEAKRQSGKVGGIIELPKITEGNQVKPLKVDFGKPTSRLDWIPSALNALVNVPSESITEALNAWSNLFSGEKKTAAKTVGQGVEAVTKTVGAVFTPITTAFSVAEKVPILEYPVKAVNKVFETAGKVGGAVTRTGVEVLPFVSKEAKEELLKPFEELGALVAQLAVGGSAAKGGRAYKALEGKLDAAIADKAAIVRNKGVVITPTVARKVVESAIRELKIKEKRAEAEAAKPKVEPQKVITAKTQQAVDSLISEMNRSASKTISRPFIEERINAKGYPSAVREAAVRIMDEIGDRATKADFQDRLSREFAVEQAKPPAEAKPLAEAVEVKPAEAVKPTAPEIIPTAPEGVKWKPPDFLKPPEGAETKPSKPAADLVEEALDKAVIKERLSLPEGETLKMDRAREVTRDLIKNDPEGAMEIAMGRRDAPRETRASMVWEAMSEYAMMTRNSEMVRKLAMESSVPRMGAEAGRFSKAFDFNELATSAVDTTVRLTKIREKAAERRYGKEPAKRVKEIERKSMDKEIGKKKLRKSDWESFIDSIVC